MTGLHYPGAVALIGLRLTPALVASCVSLAAVGQTVAPAGAQADPYSALTADTRPLASRWETDYSGYLEAGVGWVSDDNFMFGQYNGLYQSGAVFIGNVHWLGWRDNSPQYWLVDGRDLGLETRQGKVEWGIAGERRLAVFFDNQLQVKNDTARTPFYGVGSDSLTLPSNWEGGANTSDWGRLYPALGSFERKLERNRYGLQFDTALGAGWSLQTALSSEQKDGIADLGGAIYNDAAGPLAVLLPQPVDQRTTDFDLALRFAGRALNLVASYHLSDFTNNENLLSWQNPYSAGYGPAVDYPNGSGALALAPDNRYQRLRLTGNWIVSPALRVMLDGSYARAAQRDDFADYTINPALRVDQPLPRGDLDAELTTTTLALNVHARATRNLTLEARYRYADRDNDSPRDGYLYVRGDGADQPAPKYTAYNAPHDTRRQTFALEGGYRLPKRTKLRLEYAFDRVDRRNAAVEKTEENSIRGQLNINTWQPLTARIELLYADLAADTYQWAQSYYSRYDTELINETPDNQRFSNHPLLSQYHLSNRERLRGKIDLNYLLSSRWNLAFNLLWREDDFDKSTLGLIDERTESYIFSANYQAHADLSFNAYLNYNRYSASQSGRAFRGGVEKNAFAVSPPLPQASDPGRNWDVDSDDTVQALGLAMQWRALPRLDLEVDYSFVNTDGENTFKSYGAPDLDTTPVPDRETRQHQLRLSGRYHMRDNLTLNLHYQYFYYQSDNWAIDDVAPDTINKVLSFGEQSPDEGINYLGLSVNYRLP